MAWSQREAPTSGGEGWDPSACPPELCSRPGSGAGGCKQVSPISKALVPEAHGSLAPRALRRWPRPVEAGSGPPSPPPDGRQHYTRFSKGNRSCGGESSLPTRAHRGAKAPSSLLLCQHSRAVGCRVAPGNQQDSRGLPLLGGECEWLCADIPPQVHKKSERDHPPSFQPNPGSPWDWPSSGGAASPQVGVGLLGRAGRCFKGWSE